MATGGWPDDGLGGAVTLEVTCQTRRGAVGRQHPVEIAPDWSATTPHDLELERIGVAMGGYLSCLDLVDRVLPAVRDLWRHRARVVRPLIGESRRGRWRALEPVRGCECRTGWWPEAVAAAEHLRTPVHWALRHGAPPREVAALESQWFRDTGPSLGLAVDRLRSRVVEGHGLDTLWDVGIPPSVMTELSDRLNGGIEPLPWLLYRDCVFGDVDVAWLSGFAAYDGTIMAWAARTATERDREEPALRRLLLELDAHPQDVAALLESDYTPADVEALGAATALSFRQSATVCAAWVAIGCEPDVADLALLARSRPLPTPAGGIQAVEHLLVRCPPEDRPTFAEAALVLATAGTVGVADTLIQMGVRTVEQATAIL